MLTDIMALASDAQFQQRVQAQLVTSCVNAYIEALNETQTISITGGPTGGSFTLASLPGSQVVNTNGTTANASPNITGLATTAGLFVGMSVIGQGIPANATISTITGPTSITISGNSSGSATVQLTFSGTSPVVIPWNATWSDIQAILQYSPQIAHEDVVCSGGPLPGTGVAVTFCNNLGYSPQRLMTVGLNSLIGGTVPTPVITRTTQGMAGQPNHGKRAARASVVLNNPSNYSQAYVFGVAADAVVQTAFIPQKKQTDVTDTMILNAVVNIFNAYL